MSPMIKAGGGAGVVAAVATLLLVGCSDANPAGPHSQASDNSANSAPVAPAAHNGTPVILSFPGGSPGAPVYAFIAGFFMNTDGEWVAIELFRQRRCIPNDFNLLQFADFGNAVNCPLTMKGTEWWYAQDLADAGGPWQTVPPFPFQARYEPLGASVPIYFVRLTELEAAMGDGQLSISELEALPSLRIGLATKYEMIQHNSNQGNAPGHSRTVASGPLVGGGTFQYYKTDRDNVTISVKIEFRGVE